MHSLRESARSRCASRWLPAAGLAALLTVCAVSPVRAASEDCAAWPGEISPLPSTDSRDAFAARWARLRAAELVKLANALADSQPAAAYRLWNHAGCLAPRDMAIQERLSQFMPALASLPAPIVVRSKPAEDRRPRIDLGPIDRDMDAVIAAISEARFRDALTAAEPAREALGKLSATTEVLERRARLEVMTGTAQLALGMEAEASSSLERALEADPDLTLDEQTPPKVRRLLASVREAQREASR
jgi:hypothetical protein